MQQYDLGVMYDDGQGVAQDSKEAVKWFRKAADQGFANAQYDLGVMNASGLGVEQDLKEAVKWYQQGCRSGICKCAIRPWGDECLRPRSRAGFKGSG